MNSRKPITYDESVDIRFSDLDSYGHVNSKHYVDFVSTARIVFMEKTLKTTIEDAAKKGIGFYLTKSTINYLRPITGLVRVRCRSHVHEIRDGKVLVIPFELLTEDGKRKYSDGTLEFTIVDMNTKRTTSAPEWVADLFFERGEPQ